MHLPANVRALGSQQPPAPETAAPPRRKTARRFRPKIRWEYGKQSDFALWICEGGNWFFPLFSHDVRSKFRPKQSGNERTEAEKIRHLQKLFLRGKCGKQSWNPASARAWVVPREAKSVSEAVCRTNPDSGAWETYTPPAFLPQKSGENAVQWSLWLPLNLAAKKADEKPQTVYCKPDDGAFRQYCREYPQNPKSAAIFDRYADPETGELPPGLLPCLWLARQAVLKMRENPAKFRGAYIYRNGKQHLRVDAAEAVICGIGAGGGWAAAGMFE